MKTIVLVTASSMPKPDPESHLLVTALEQRGVRSQMLAWDAEFDWSSADLVVVRSAWDYFERLDEFLSWADAVESVSCLVNRAAVLRWNTHKRYLTELVERGVPTVPTVVVTNASALPDRRRLQRDLHSAWASLRAVHPTIDDESSQRMT